MKEERVCYKMFPYIVTFQNKLKGVIIQYIRKILGVIFTIHYSLSVFLHYLALKFLSFHKNFTYYISS